MSTDNTQFSIDFTVMLSPDIIRESGTQTTIDEESQMNVTDTLRQHLDKATESASLNSIAIAAGMDRAVLFRFQTGERMLSGDSIDRLADHFGLKLRPTPKPKRKATSKRK